MEPVTHTAISYALARAGLASQRREVLLVLVAGVTADLDRFTWLAGPAAFLQFRAGPTHSIPGILLLAAMVAAGFCWLARRNQSAPLSFVRAFLLSVSAAGVHLLLDCVSGDGISPWWPLGPARYALDFVAHIDPWIFVFLALGLLLPGLFRLITEEIGARPARRGPQRGAVLALMAVALYLGVRWRLQDRAMEILASRMYHDALPRAVGAFPAPVSPLLWRGVVETENTLEEIEVSLKPGSFFDPEASNTYFKPESGPALDAARSTHAVTLFLAHARFPIARMEKIEAGWRVELRDLRHSISLWQPGGFLAVVELDSQLRVLREELLLIEPGR